MRSLLALLAAALLVPSCTGGSSGETGPTEAFSGIGDGERIYAAGTEPFWRVDIEDGLALYTTPENQAGLRFPVMRFSGNSGLGITGTLEGVNFDLAVTPGQCSDGMSERIYPFVATLRLGSQVREGCAWTDAQAFSGPAAP